MKPAIQVSPMVQLVTYYDRQSRSWWAFYRDAMTGNQLGSAWNAATREEVLIFRLDIPEPND